MSKKASKKTENKDPFIEAAENVVATQHAANRDEKDRLNKKAEFEASDKKAKESRDAANKAKEFQSDLIRELK